jgi:hypothetical protein
MRRKVGLAALPGVVGKSANGAAMVVAGRAANVDVVACSFTTGICSSSQKNTGGSPLVQPEALRSTEERFPMNEHRSMRT